MSDCLLWAIVAFVIGVIAGGCLMADGTIDKEKVTIKLTNTMNSSMLDCVTHNVITKEQVHAIEDVFHKHIEENFDFVKANHGNEE